MSAPCAGETANIFSGSESSQTLPMGKPEPGMIASNLYLTSTKGVERIVVRQWEGECLPCFGGMFSGVYLLPYLPC